RKYPEEFALKQRLEHTIKVPKIVAENEEHKELLEKIKNDEIHESVSRKLKGLSESGKTNH
ncbi:MAG: hypothetical protein N2692_03055, partial [Patescibacteria group bacterium]|nr:hypothetical protein [Patescibacteria group bacterium]